ncbi:hypothetical protein K491DRAFT_696589 [Lophiostoma macrostomum CBS 122681]|uniref:CENP-V/GFA domain-containing protein n=1 Tax=Lophiostoma macrostomum CBS 122681 TaxID=1314788 RepID=A0A6A6SU19_9PLEO|nr:hypothetical protein K491DRAFT_696589 [Lophiostoma macrostomum CBS 122681]
MAETTQLTVSCHCSSANHTFSVPNSLLPLPTNLCNCNISRRISGSLLTSYVNITFDDGVPKPDTSALTPYRSSSILTRHFCSTCGTHMYLEYHADGHYEAATGTFQLPSTDGIIEFKSQMWIEDTKDGGASQFLTHIDNEELPRYLRESDQSPDAPLEWTLHTPATSTSEVKKSVHAHCHCNGVEFYITAPDATSYASTSGYPDLLVPYQSSPQTISLSNRSNQPWWIQRHGTRFLAGTCTCNSCRRASGFDITFWAFIPSSNIFRDSACTQAFIRNPDPEGAGSEKYWGTMKSYTSSPGVTRTFCSICGANVFWDGRPGREEEGSNALVDVAVGLLDAGSGARAEEFLAWWPGRVSFREEASNKGLVKGLEEGLASWTERNQGKEYVADGENVPV